MKVPPRPNFSKDSDDYFVHAYNRLIEFQSVEVSMGNWKLDHVKNDLPEIVATWEVNGLGEIRHERNKLGGIHFSFLFNAKGIAKGKKMLAAMERSRKFRNFRLILAKNLNHFAVWLSAVAAIAAAYFSYLGLPTAK